MVKILSFSERIAQAQAAGNKRTQSVKAAKQTNDKTKDITRSLEEMGFKILDEAALKDIVIGGQNKISLELIALLREKKIIAYAESSNTQSQETPKIHQEEKPTAKADQPKQTQQEIKPEKQEKPKDELPYKHEDTHSRKIWAITEKTPETQPQKKEKKPEKNQSASWEQGYVKSLTRWCETNTDKKTNKPKREIAETKVEENKTAVTVKPISPIAKKRGDKGAIYQFSQHPHKKDTVEVTLGSPDNSPLNYDYFYALIKAGIENGVEVIEFKDIKTPEFRDKLLAAALQFKQKHKNLQLKNAPGVIDLNAEHLKFMPPQARENLKKYNECVKKALAERGKEIMPEKGSKYGEGPRAEERTHAEKVYIESQLIEEKMKRAEKRRKEMEKQVNSPSKAEYDQHPERGNRDPAQRRNRNNRNRSFNGKTPLRPTRER